MNDFCRFAATAAIANVVPPGLRFRQFIRVPVRPSTGRRYKAHAYANPYGDGGANPAPICGARLSTSGPARRRAASSSTRRTSTSISSSAGGQAMRYGIGVGREGFTGRAPSARAQGRMAGLDAAAGDDRAPAHLPRFMAGGPAIRSAPAPCISAARSTASTAPTLPRPSAPGVVGLHPHDQRGRDRPLQPRQHRHQGRRTAYDRAPRADPVLR